MTGNSITQSSDYVTVVTMDVPTGKLYEVIEGVVKKTPAANNANGWGVTHHVPDVEALSALLVTISTEINCALILGFIGGTEDGKPYRLMSSANFEIFAKNAGIKLDKFASKPFTHEGVKYATRTKRMMHPSSFFGFDRDVVDGMPDELEPGAPFPRWLEMLNDMLPEIRGVSYVAIKSASCRVNFKGVPMASTNIHVYMQAKEAMDTERFGKAGMIHSFARGYGFMRPIKDRNTGKVIGNRPWTLYDPTTFSRERLFFDGSPILNPIDPAVISGELTVSPTEPLVYKGQFDRVNTRALAIPTKEAQRAQGLEIEVDKQGRVTIINPVDLTPDISFEFHNRATGERGEMTMAEFVAGDVDRLSCQSVFRPDSASMAAYVSKEDDCEPFMYDVGTNINYKYNAVKEAFASAIAGGIIETSEVQNDGKQNNNSDANNGAGNSHNTLDHTVSVGVQINETPRPPVTIEHDVSLSNDAIPKPPSDGFVAPDLSHLKIERNDNVTNIAYSDMGLKEAKVGLPTFGALHMLAPEFGETDLGNAQRFAHAFDGEFKYVPIFASWFRWFGNRWVKCEDGEARTAAHILVSDMAKAGNELPSDNSSRKWAKASCGSTAIGSMVREAATIPKMIVSLKNIDNSWYNFGVGNGYIDLRLDTSDRSLARPLIGFNLPSRELFLTKAASIDYVEGATAPEWEAALWEIFSHDRELINFFQIFVGYSMCGNPVHEVLAFLVGGGSNGKSTITGVLEKIFGEYKATVDKSVLMTKRDNNSQGATPALARLKGIRLAVLTEPKEGDRIDESVVKSLSGSDTITARHLHGNTFEFEATFVSWIATNHAPNIRSVDEGTWRRILIIPFKRNFLKEKGREGIDTGLKGRIIDNELSGVLNWCLEGVRQYHLQGFVPPQSVMRSTDKYRDEQDIIANWFDSCLEVGDSYEVTFTQLWQSYTAYSASLGDELIRQGRTLNAKISAKGFSKIKHVSGSNSERGFKGLRIRHVQQESDS